MENEWMFSRVCCCIWCRRYWILFICVWIGLLEFVFLVVIVLFCVLIFSILCLCEFWFFRCWKVLFWGWKVMGLICGCIFLFIFVIVVLFWVFFMGCWYLWDNVCSCFVKCCCCYVWGYCFMCIICFWFFRNVYYGSSLWVLNVGVCLF